VENCPKQLSGYLLLAFTLPGLTISTREKKRGLQDGHQVKGRSRLQKIFAEKSAHAVSVDTELIGMVVSWRKIHL
jgi:hypothetical protein